eukprot:351719-Chlamydomonas_euryale.AAC.1
MGPIDYVTRGSSGSSGGGSGSSGKCSEAISYELHGGTRAGLGGTRAGTGGTDAGIGGTRAGIGGTCAGIGGTRAGTGGTRVSREGPPFLLEEQGRCKALPARAWGTTQYHFSVAAFCCRKAVPLAAQGSCARRVRGAAGACDVQASRTNPLPAAAKWLASRGRYDSRAPLPALASSGGLHKAGQLGAAQAAVGRHPQPRWLPQIATRPRHAAQGSERSQVYRPGAHRPRRKGSQERTAPGAPIGSPSPAPICLSPFPSM